MDKNKEDRKCRNCNASIAGRLDKKYCDDTCRSSHHNVMYRKESVFHKPITRILVRNRKILEVLKARNIRYTNKTYLIESGFHFDFVTHVHENDGGKQYRFCYEFGYFLDEHNRIKIMHRPPNLW